MIARALQNIRPGCLWDCEGHTYDGLIWKDPSPKPSKEEVEAELVRLNKEYEANEYQHNRAKEYPSFADQFDLLYHGGYDAWKAEIDKVKNKYPKVTDAN
jgi:hypothetical protein